MKKNLAILALTFAMFSSYAQSQVVVWSEGQVLYNSKDEKVDSISFQKLSKAGSTTIPSTETGPIYKEVKPTYTSTQYSGYCYVILGSVRESTSNFYPGVTDNNFGWVEIYDKTGALIESTDQWTGVYQVPHNGWIIPYFKYSRDGYYWQKITVKKLDKLKISYNNLYNYYIE